MDNSTDISGVDLSLKQPVGSEVRSSRFGSHMDQKESLTEGDSQKIIGSKQEIVVNEFIQEARKIML